MKKESKALDDAEKCIEALKKESVEGSPLRVDDIDWAVKDLLWESVKKELDARSVTQTMGSDYMVRYIGIKHPAIDIEGGAKKLAEKVNDVCMAYKVVGQLSTALKFDLFYQGEEEGPQAFFLYYIAFTPQAAERIDLEMKHDPTCVFFDAVGGGFPNEEGK